MWATPTKVGTKIAFKADPEIFEEVRYDFETLLDRLREQAFLNAGVRIAISDQREVEKVEDRPAIRGRHYQLCGVSSHKRGLKTLHDDVIFLSGQSETGSCDVAMQYSDSYYSLILSFANNIHTGEGGTHEIGFKNALTRVMNDYGRKTNILKEKDTKPFRRRCREGITVIVSVKLQEAQFEARQRASWQHGNPRPCGDTVYDKLMTYFEENPSTARAILEKSINAYRARVAPGRPER